MIYKRIGFREVPVFESGADPAKPRIHGLRLPFNDRLSPFELRLAQRLKDEGPPVFFYNTL